MKGPLTTTAHMDIQVFDGKSGRGRLQRSGRNNFTTTLRIPAGSSTGTDCSREVTEA